MLFTPTSMVKEVINNAHGQELTGHWAAARTIERCILDYFWPTMAADVAIHIRNCRRCHDRRPAVLP
jgi:hypothetical protein